VAIDIWAGGGWLAKYPTWPEDAVAPDPYDPVDVSGYNSNVLNNYEKVGGSETEGSGIVTITFLNDTEYNVANAGDVSGNYILAAKSIVFVGDFTRQIIVDGAKGDSTIRPNPVTIRLSGVSITTVTGASPIALQNGANVIFGLEGGTNTLTAMSGDYAGLQVPVNNKATILGYSYSPLIVTGASNGAGLGSNNQQACGTISIGRDTKITATGGDYAAGIFYFVVGPPRRANNKN
jgi:hypothetical protein